MSAVECGAILPAPAAGYSRAASSDACSGGVPKLFVFPDAPAGAPAGSGSSYLGSLLALLLQSFYSGSTISRGMVVHEFTLRPMPSCSCAQNLDIIIRTVSMAVPSRSRPRFVAFPIAYYAARYAAGSWKAVFYLRHHAAAVVELSGQESMPGS